MTNWLTTLHSTNAVAHAVMVLSLVCVGGMALGDLKIRGIGLGTSGVLFAGIVVGHFGRPVSHETLEFVKEFGLILFVFTMGLQLGPGFFAALRAQGLRLNLLAGSMTDPPALAFASNLSKSEAPTVAYAAVYPLTTLLRILCAQILALALCR